MVILFCLLLYFWDKARVVWFRDSPVMCDDSLWERISAASFSSGNTQLLFILVVCGSGTFLKERYDDLNKNSSQGLYVCKLDPQLTELLGKD